MPWWTALNKVLSESLGAGAEGSGPVIVLGSLIIVSMGCGYWIGNRFGMGLFYSKEQENAALRAYVYDATQREHQMRVLIEENRVTAQKVDLILVEMRELNQQIKQVSAGNVPPLRSVLEDSVVSTFVGANAPEHWQIGFQPAATTMMDGIIHLHHDIMLFLCTILFFVLTVLIALILLFAERQVSVRFAKGFVNWSRKLWTGSRVPVQQFHTGHGVTHHTVLETVWTIIPTLILLTIATPSFALIYGLDEIVTPAITLRVVGHQWYWTYDFVDSYKARITPVTAQTTGEKLPLVGVPLSGMDQGTLTLLEQRAPAVLAKVLSSKQTLALQPLVFNSYMVPTDDLPKGALRLLETDAELTLPVHTNVRLLVTAADVIHSWAVPAFGVKVDAVPGRTNEYYLHVKRLGTFYGQCSEICGVNHGFMPIKVRVVSPFEFLSWYRAKSENQVYVH